jgi:4-hydroxyphenylpyruvate dioxygenase-like putative hemolysin
MKSSPEYREKWYKVVEDYKLSNLSMKKYAAVKNIKYYQFQYWVRKYNDLNKDQTKQFVKVETNKAIISSSVFKISYGKLTIELQENFNEKSLLKLLKVADQVV